LHPWIALLQQNYNSFASKSYAQRVNNKVHTLIDIEYEDHMNVKDFYESLKTSSEDKEE